MFDVLVTCYLFLGGSSAGACALLVVLCWLCPETATAKDRWSEIVPYTANQTLRELHLGKALAKVIDVGFPACLIMLCVGILCLAADLAADKGVTILLKNPAPSIITAGAFLLVLLAAACALLSIWRNLSMPAPARPVALATEIAGLACSIGVMAYTGVLLESMGAGIPLWDTPLIPVLFVLSSLSAGCGIVIACAALAGALKPASLAVSRLLAFDTAIIAAEAVCAAAFAIGALQDPTAAPAASRLVSGDLSFVFWGCFISAGLAFPIALKLAAKRLGLLAQATAVAIAISLAVGAFGLRTCIVDAGMHPDANAEFLAIQLAQNEGAKLAEADEEAGV